MKKFPRKLAAAGLAFSLACATGPVNAAPADMLSGFLRPSAFYSGPVVPPYGFSDGLPMPLYGVPPESPLPSPPPYGFGLPQSGDFVTPDYGIPCDDFVVPPYGICDDFAVPEYGFPCDNYVTPPYGIPSPAVLGDVNGDGRITSADATMLARAIAGHFDDDPDFELPLAAADIDRDGIITVDDVVKLARWLVGQFPNGI